MVMRKWAAALPRRLQAPAVVVAAPSPSSWPAPLRGESSSSSVCWHDWPTAGCRANAGRVSDRHHSVAAY